MFLQCLYVMIQLVFFKWKFLKLIFILIKSSMLSKPNYEQNQKKKFGKYWLFHSEYEILEFFFFCWSKEKKILLIRFFPPHIHFLLITIADHFFSFCQQIIVDDINTHSTNWNENKNIKGQFTDRFFPYFYLLFIS